MRKYVVLCALTLWSASLVAQDDKSVTVSGSVHSEILIPQEDKTIGAEKSDDKVLTNTYADIALGSKWVDAGARFEFLEFPLPGYEKDFKGWGVPNFWVKGKLNRVELTLGSTYDQFGSGFIYRTYEQRNLGIDNSLLGARAVWRADGFTVKAVTGRQRRYWSWNKAWVSGADAEINLEQWARPLQQHNAHLMLGASWVNKHESQEDLMADATHKLNFPTYVNAWDVRARYQQGPFSVLVEYARKSQDPSFDNIYTYGPGHVEMLMASYSRKGLSALVQVKRSENMSFRSRRSMNGVSSMINHLPAFSMEHTYALAAIYPYATNTQGEWAYQGELSYLFAKKTALGGKYGTKVRLNFSHIHSLKVTEPSAGMGSDGLKTSFWGWGKNTYYQDLNIQLEKKLSRTVKLNLMYMNQFYNKTYVEGEGGMVHSDIAVAEVRWNMTKKWTLRSELQYLSTKDDEGDWIYGLLELSWAPHWMFTISDMYNSGETKIHYYQGLITYNVKSHRLQVGYGRTRAGYNCAGGVCRYVPASRGVTVAYNYNF